MSYVASLSTLEDPAAAAEEVTREVLRQLEGKRPDLAFLFVSPSHAQVFEEIGPMVFESLKCGHLVGCTGESIAGGGREIEDAPAVSIWAANLPDAELDSFHVTFGRAADGIFCDGLPEFSTVGPTNYLTMFLLGDPYSCAVDSVISRVSPGLPLIGGMASGGSGPGENRLFLDGETLDSGGVGVVVRGGPRIRSIVSQGCRPIGTPFVVTRAEQNVIHELGGKRTLDRLQELYAGLSQPDRELVNNGLHLGIVMNEYQDKFQRGDFLIANVIGADQESGSVAIANLVRTGQTVQFHVRDAQTADEELRLLLQRAAVESTGFDAALMFTCNGRGTRLFPQPHHDAATIQSICGPLPLAGFFAQGELGPVGNKNYIHGYTASIALFELE